MHAELQLTLDHARAWLAAQVDHLAGHDLLPTLRTENAAEFTTDFGTFRVEAAARELRIRVDGKDRDGTEILQGSIAEYLISRDGTLAEHLVWRGHRPQEARPVNFREMRVCGRRRISPWMLRLTLRGEDIGHFGERGLHIRLLLPKIGADGRPVWPRRTASGAVEFPKGDTAPTMRVYTVRAIRPETGEIDVDIVRHAGGAFSQWADQAEEGALLGVMGPGGGFLPAPGWLLIGGDETALPAVARILETLPADTLGRAVIGLRHADARLGLAAPPGVTVDWVVTGALVGTFAAVTPPANADTVAWFAGEAEDARRLRTHFKERLALASGRFTSAAYWRRGVSG